MTTARMTPAQRDQIAAILRDAADLTIATNREDGWPQATTVSFVADGVSIYFGTWTQSQKFKNIARDPRVSITVNPTYQTWNAIRGVSLAGRARRVADANEQNRVMKLMLEKFPQLGDFVQPADAEMALFRVDPEVVSILDYTQGFGHTELVQAA